LFSAGLTLFLGKWVYRRGAGWKGVVLEKFGEDVVPVGHKISWATLELAQGKQGVADREGEM